MSEHTRNRILQSSLQLILAKGYDGTRTREIADMTGVSEATIFKHFKTKEELMKSLIVDMIDKFSIESKVIIAKTLKDFQKKAKFSYSELLRQIIIERINYFVKANSLIKIIVREMLINPGLKKLFIETIYNNLINILDVIIRKGVEAGEFKNLTDSKELKDIIFGLIIYNTVIHSAISTSPSGGKAEQITDIILKGVIA